MKTIIIFVKVHIWIGYSIDFNQAKSNEECTVHSGVSKCFEVGTNSGKAGGCDIEIVCHKLIVMTSVAGDIQLSSRQNSGRRLVYLLIINTVID